ncbi:MAG: cyclic peptide export ABC transporter, partial [Polyangiaceae bacterium]
VVIGGVLFVLGDALGLEPRVRSGYAIVFLYMMLPLHALVEASPEISRTRVALERINALGVASSSDAPAPKTTDALDGEAFRSLRLSHVRYEHRHEGDDSVFELGPIDLELRPGEVVFLIGGNGSGKTTLAKLLTGLYEPSAGSIHVNDRPLEPGRLEGYRQLFSAVFADFHLFQTLLGLEGEALDARAQSLLELLALGHKVSVTNGVFSSTELSRGQQKRLALVVATLEDRPVYVFDEWAADQDPAYKDVFYRRILPELKARGKSLFVITHDDRFFHLADRCLKLESGTLREVDPHSAALAAHEPTHSVHDVRKDLALGERP